MKPDNKPNINLVIYIAMITSMILIQPLLARPLGTKSEVGGNNSTAVNAGNPYVNANGFGQVLIFPYYTVRGGQKSFFNVTNTSDETVAVKVRFREGHNSRDALNFNLILAPKDVWAGWMEEGDSGPVVRSNDYSCVAGASLLRTTGQPLSNIAYSDDVASFQDQGSNSIDRTREGYVVVTAMGRAPAGDEDSLLPIVAPSPTALPAHPVVYYAKHINGSPRDCAKVSAAFFAGSGAGTEEAPDLLSPVAFPFADSVGSTLGGTNGTSSLANRPAAQARLVDPKGDGDTSARSDFQAFAEGSNPLKGNFTIVNVSTGIAAGNTAVAIADFMNTEKTQNGMAAATEFEQATYGSNLITAQDFPYYLEPSLASRDGIWTMSGLRLFEAAISSKKIINEWADSASTGAATDWSITFPSKAFHVDNKTIDLNDSNGNRSRVDFVKSTAGFGGEVQNIQAANNQWRTNDTNTQIPSIPFKDNIEALGSVIEFNLFAYNRNQFGRYLEPGSTVPGSYIPPPYYDKNVMFHDANILSFRAESKSAALSSINFVLVSDLGSLEAAQNGWIELTLKDATNASLPMVGWAYKSRNQGNPNLSFGQILEHGWK